MAIFANTVGDNTYKQSLPLRLNKEIINGSILVYDGNEKVFVDKLPDGSSGGINGGRNKGGNNVPKIYAGRDGNTMEFRSIQAGSGIVIDETSDLLVISSDVNAGSLSVAGSYRIVIDNNDDEPEAKFEIYTVRSYGESAIVLNQPTLIQTILDSYTTNGIYDRGEIQIHNGDFYNLGYRPGMWISFIDGGNQSGFWQIEQVVKTMQNGIVISSLVLTELFSGEYALNLGGPKPNSQLIVHDWVVRNNVIYSHSIDFYQLGIRDGMRLTLTNGNKNGQYVIESVSERVDDFTQSAMILSQTTPIDDGFISYDTTMSIDPFETSTGFYVSKNGHVSANSMSIGSNQVATISDIQAYGPSMALMYYFANL
ncbi:MAG: hypothetical protein WC284_16815 [Candidimonas sp.]